MRRLAIVGLVGLVLAGCASSSSGGWTKAGVSEQQLGRDTADCLAQARMIVSGPRGSRTVVEQDRYRRCMRDRGYEEAPAR